MRIQSDLIQDDFQELKKESKEVLGLEGELYPPFGASQDYVEYQIFDINDNFKERKKSINYTLEDGKIVLNIGQDLRDAGYNRGSYKVRYYFIRPKAGDSEEVVLTKTVNGRPGIIHSGNPELTGVPMGDFYLDDDGQAFVGLVPPADGDPQPLDIKEFKYKIESISGDRTEVRIIPQIIENQKYNETFRKLVSDTNTYRSTKTSMPTQQEINQAVEEALVNGQDPQEILANLEGEAGGEISFTGPDSIRIEFNSRLDNVDNGFTQKMRRGKLVIKNAYITDYSSQPDVSQNSSFNIEDPIPTLYIQSIKQEGTRIVDYQLFTEDGNIFNPNINGVQFYWEFGCGHKQEASTNSNATHEYDVDGNYSPSVYVFTPNFSEEVTELRTPSGRVLNQIDTSLVLTEEQATDDEPIDSVFNGKIIKWDGVTTEPQGIPQKISGQAATTNSRWYVQDGYRRWISSDYNLEKVRELKGLEPENDVELYAVLINQIPAGPSIGGGTFSNVTPPNLNETITNTTPGIQGTLGFFIESNIPPEDEEDDDTPPQDNDTDTNSSPFVVTIVNSPINSSGPLVNQTAGSMVAFMGDNYTTTTDSADIEKPFDSSQIVSFKGKGMGAMGVNVFVGFFDDPDFTQPSFNPQPEADEVVDVFLDSSRTYYAKVTSGL
tara:strand:+ start:3869 stop:5854 length:1986 start_codon:yes stop_codon:yes gene_type:complete